MNVRLLNKKNNILVIFLLFLCSCFDGNHEMEYHQNGNVKSNCSIINGIKNGLCIKYYDNNVIKYLSTYEDGKLNGLAFSYDSIGNLSKTQTWKDGKLNGVFQTFYSNKSIKEKYFVENGKMKGVYLLFYPDGKLKEKKEYIIRDEQSELNQYISYNSNREIQKEKSNYFTIISKKDTISINDYYEIKVILSAPVFNYMRVLVGDYSDDFGALEKDTLKNIINGNSDFVALLTITPKQKGINRFSGIIDNYNYISESDNTDKKYKSRYIYFSKSFFVK